MCKKIIKRLKKSHELKPIWTAKEAVHADDFTHHIGIAPHLLMENAGKAVADKVLSVIKKTSRKPHIILFIGPGDNGADAVVAARHLLACGLKIVLYIVGGEKKPSTLSHSISNIKESHSRDSQ